jgi:hypothetical protein
MFVLLDSPLKIVSNSDVQNQSLACDNVHVIVFHAFSLSFRAEHKIAERLYAESRNLQMVATKPKIPRLRSPALRFGELRSE